MTPNTNKGLFIKLIQNGLQSWIRHRCKIKDGSLEVDLHSTNKELLNGRIRKANIQAENINFNNLIFKRVKLSAEEIEFHLNIIKRKFSIYKNFILSGELSIEENDLYMIITTNQWKFLSKVLEKELIDGGQIKMLRLENKYINIKFTQNNKADEKSSCFKIKAINGKIVILSEDESRELSLPMDQNINIEKVYIDNRALILKGTSKVLI